MVLLIGLLQGALPADAQNPNSAYIVQQGDWLSKIAQAAYGNAHGYYRIVEGSNKKAALDPSFAVITNPNKLPPNKKYGFLRCLPQII